MKQGGAISVGTGAVRKAQEQQSVLMRRLKVFQVWQLVRVLYLLEILLLQLVVNLQRQPTSHKLLVMLLLRRVKVL